jgi:hypothetical protein
MSYYNRLKQEKKDIAEFILNELHRKHDGKPINKDNFYSLRDTVEEAVQDYADECAIEDAEAADDRYDY